jgi:hypothetical protein
MTISPTRKSVIMLTAITAGLGFVALTSAATQAAEKPAIEVITHAGAGGGTDVNSRMMMLRKVPGGGAFLCGQLGHHGAALGAGRVGAAFSAVGARPVVTTPAWRALFARIDSCKCGALSGLLDRGRCDRTPEFVLNPAQARSKISQ